MVDLSSLEANGDPEFMVSLARGLAVLRCFADVGQPMTIAEASRRTGLSRPAVKRCLHTLKRLGYAQQRGAHYELQAKVLALGYAYLSSSALAVRAQPMLERLRDQVHESCSLGVMEEGHVTYVARAEVSRIISITLQVGSRLPLYCTSMGRVLLAGVDRETRENYMRTAKLTPLAVNTNTSIPHLLAIIDQVSAEGFAITDQELESGLRSIAVPVVKNGKIMAAINVGTHADRVPIADLRTRFLPVLRFTAAELAATIALR